MTELDAQIEYILTLEEERKARYAEREARRMRSSSPSVVASRPSSLPSTVDTPEPLDIYTRVIGRVTKTICACQREPKVRLMGMWPFFVLPLQQLELSPNGWLGIVLLLVNLIILIIGAFMANLMRTMSQRFTMNEADIKELRNGQADLAQKQATLQTQQDNDRTWGKATYDAVRDLDKRFTSTVSKSLDVLQKRDHTP